MKRNRRWASADQLLEEWAEVTQLGARPQPPQHSPQRLVTTAAAAAALMLVAAAVGLVVLAVPALGPGAASPSPGPGLAGAWRLETGFVDDRRLEPVEGHRVTLVVDGERTGGTAACNHYGAELQVDGDSVQVGLTSLTAMLCPDPAMVLEERYLAALPRVSAMSVHGDRLLLSGTGVELQFVRLGSPPIEEIVDRVWLLESLLDGDAAIPARESATLELDSDGTLSVTTGSRTITGKWVVYGDLIDTPELGVGGDDPPPDLARQDAHVVGVIEGGFTVRLEGDRLVIAGTDGQEGLTYRPAAATPPSPDARVVPVPTQAPSVPGTPEPCPAALEPGTLVEHPEWGVALRSAIDGVVQKVWWPHGWSAHREDGLLLLLDQNGEVVAREGDSVEVGGGELADGSFLGCGGVTVIFPLHSPSPAPAADLVGRLAGSADLEGGCAWLVDEDGKSWEIMWPAGYRLSFDGDAPLLMGADGGVIARSGDVIALSGTPGWYAEGQLIVHFDVAALDPLAAETGSTLPRRAVRDVWAAVHGLEEDSASGLGGWVLYRITDGTPTDLKLADLEQLREVRSVTRNALGSFCMVGEPFTAEEVLFVQPRATTVEP